MWACHWWTQYSACKLRDAPNVTVKAKITHETKDINWEIPYPLKFKNHRWCEGLRHNVSSLSAQSNSLVNAGSLELNKHTVSLCIYDLCPFKWSSHKLHCPLTWSCPQAASKMQKDIMSTLKGCCMSIMTLWNSSTCGCQIACIRCAQLLHHPLQ